MICVTSFMTFLIYSLARASTESVFHVAEEVDYEISVCSKWEVFKVALWRVKH